MTISDRIFELLQEKHISQKNFSEATHIPTSTISDWKKKSTNPSSDKIMIICDFLKVSPYYLLSGIEPAKGRENRADYIMISKDSKEAMLINEYNDLDDKKRQRLLGYLEAMKENPM